MAGLARLKEFGLDMLRSGAQIKLNRFVFRMGGAEATKFLQGIITQDINELKPGGLLYSNFLTPQGRVVADFFLSLAPDASSSVPPSYFLHVDSSIAQNVRNHLKRHILRSRVDLDDSGKHIVWAAFGGASTRSLDLGAADPRHENFGRQLITSSDDTKGFGLPESTAESYRLLQIVNAAPSVTTDIPLGDALPLESNLNLLNGVSFTKGCYTGQELTTRTHHTGVIRKRLVPVFLHAEGDDSVQNALSLPNEIPNESSDVFSERVAGLLQKECELPAADTDITLPSGRIAGKFRSGVYNAGLALLRLQHLGADLRCGNLKVTPVVPSWWPEQVIKPE